MVNETQESHLVILINPVSHVERAVSMAGGFVGIFAIYYVTQYFVGTESTALIVASMGASAVLLFAVPHGALAQPWNVFGGHLVSAVVGVTCAIWIPDIMLAAAASVGLAIGVMHYLRCIHPPGGATALTAVIGGSGVHALGYQFVLMPVLINVLIILAVAVAFNGLFHWRRYPVGFASNKNLVEISTAERRAPISHENFVYALSQIDTFMDITEEDLLKIYALATERDRDKLVDPEKR